MVFSKIKEMVRSWKTILLLSKKPDDEEFKLITKLTFLGFVLIGMIAYFIHLVFVIIG